MAVKRPHVRISHGARKFFNKTGAGISHTFNKILDQPKELLNSAGHIATNVTSNLELPLIIGGVCVLAYLVLAKK